MDKEQRIKQLVDELNEHGYKYYVLYNPTIADAEYDVLYDELRQLEIETGIRLLDSPTRRVGGEPLVGFLQHRHLARLWSMDKVQSNTQLLEWMQRIYKLIGSSDLNYKPEFVVEYKFDGLTLNLTYDNGVLIQAATRGNGEVGEGILAQVRTIGSIPLSIPFKGRMEVQGEGLMRLSALKKYNESASEPLKNARNAAAGALRNLDPQETQRRKLDAFFYNVGFIEGESFENHQQMIKFLVDNKLPVSPFIKYTSVYEGLIELISKVEAERNGLDYLIDGAVIKLTDFAIRNALGNTDKFPRWAVAYKFLADEITTTVRHIIWEAGRTGKITPVAIMDPVDIAGVTVTKATLNNWGDINRKQVKIGSKVLIRRSNDVIPEIMGRIDEEQEGETDIIKPDMCPSCGEKLIENGANLFCTNNSGCKMQIIAKIAHFASRDAMDIEGFSDKLAEQFYDTLDVKKFSQIYRLSYEDLIDLDKFKEKKSGNLITAIGNSKHCKLDAFIYALGIPNVGRKTARELSIKFKTLENLMAADEAALVEVDDIGLIMANSIVQYFNDKENLDEISSLLAMGVTPISDEMKVQGVFTNMQVVLTGSLNSMGRSEAEEIISAQGGTPSSSVSKKTNLVIAGEKVGSKLAKATSLGIKVIDEVEFLKLIGNTH